MNPPQESLNNSKRYESADVYPSFDDVVFFYPCMESLPWFEVGVEMEEVGEWDGVEA